MLETLLMSRPALGTGLAGIYRQVHGNVANASRRLHVFDLLNDFAYTHGGFRDGVAIGDMHRFNFNTETWSPINAVNPPSARYGHAHCVLNNKLYIFGGVGPLTATSFVYDPATNTWTAIASLPVALYYHSAVAINGKIYIHGGYDGANQLSTTIMYDPVTNAYTYVASGPGVRHGHSAVAFEGKMYIAGGVLGPNNHRDICVYNPATNIWATLLSGTGPNVSYSGRMALLDRRFYIYGGQFGGYTTFDSLWEYKIDTNTWRQMTSGATPRFGPGILMRNKKMYIFAGGDPTFTNTGNLSDLWEIR